MDSQPINFINNGGFEEAITHTSTPSFAWPKYWGAADSSKFFGELLSEITPPIKVPFCSYTYQWPRHGNNHLISTQYCSCTTGNIRGYPRNRLKQNLKTNTPYCFSMYLNLSNQSTHAIDAMGVYFGDGSIDTISQCNKIITYLTPQIKNATNNILSDTLNWVLFQGQFTASGNEKYAMIGNFESNLNTNKVLVNSANLPGQFTSYLIDDVSLIELNLSAFAGNDTVIFAGDSLFLGTESDVGIDEACIWYKLPGTVPIDTIAGFWIKPTATSTFVVKQEICGMVKWDTVTVYLNAVDVTELKKLDEFINIYPTPTNDIIKLNASNFLTDATFDLTMIDNFGRVVRKQEIAFSKDGLIDIKIYDLPTGIYNLQLVGNAGVLMKKFVVSR